MFNVREIIVSTCFDLTGYIGSYDHKLLGDGLPFFHDSCEQKSFLLFALNRWNASIGVSHGFKVKVNVLVY